jgi:RNA polymerase sigma-70 factor (ECF subfamily)
MAVALAGFLCAAEDGDVDSLELMLTDDAVLYADGQAVAGPAPIARFIVESTGRDGPCHVQLATVDGRPGRLLRGYTGDVVEALSVDDLDGRIRAVHVVRDPDTLARL